MNVDLLHLWTAAGTFAKGVVIVLAFMSFLSLTVAITKLISIMRLLPKLRKLLRRRRVSLTNSNTL